MTTVLLTLLVLALSGWLLAAASLYLRQPGRLYLRTRELASTPEQHGLRYETVQIQAADGVRLHGWFVPCEHATQTVLFCHGNRGNIGDRIETVSMYHELGYHVFLFDYRGYGNSEGRPNEHGTYLDAVAAWDYLTHIRRFLPQQLFVHGRSLGAAIASWLAAQYTPRALIIESTFTSLPDIAALHFRWLPARLLSHYRYPVIDNLARVRCPVLVAHSPSDEVIPFSHAERLYEVIRGEKAFLKLQGNHYAGYMETGRIYTSGVAEFLKKYPG